MRVLPLIIRIPGEERLFIHATSWLAGYRKCRNIGPMYNGIDRLSQAENPTQVNGVEDLSIPLDKPGQFSHC